ncbi:MAG: hypothetical protein A3E81_01745 [Gammaproteobacteria bacterium RIFCSPHIGHO2_12_FULL_36_30]|nr:MAG: hypothetical protein A3E81_01745 [Gammaproteobacteria bacterium RIFCSPHIGHO2_12_FULL_36_30]
MEMDLKLSVDEILEKGCGYFHEFKFQQDELQQIICFIEEQWLNRIKQKSKEHWQQFSEIGIKRYHELAHLLDHGSTWAKEARMLPKNIVAKIRSMSLIKKIEAEYGSIIIVDEEKIGYEEIDWRLVRPNQPGDVGPFHADSWFLELGHGVAPPENMKAIKVWVALCCEPSLNGLKVVPNSQKKKWRYHGEFRHSFIKPKIDEDEDGLPSILLNTQPGDAVLFHERLLHAGALNRGRYTRVSMEFMIFVKK